MFERISRFTFGLFFLVGVCAVSTTPAQEPADPQAEIPVLADGAYLGVSVGIVPRLLATHLPDLLSPDLGVVILGVSPQSPADAAGLLADDVLLEIDGIKIRDGQHLVEHLSTAKSGQAIEVMVVRQGKLLKTNATLAARPADLPMLPPMFPGFPGNRAIPDFGQPGFGMPGFGQPGLGGAGVEEMQESMRRMNEMMDRMNQEFSKGFGQPGLPAIPNVQPQLQPGTSSSSSFMSMSVTRTNGNRLNVSLKYKAEDGEIRELNVEGTPEEVRQAAEEDEKMPANLRNQLFRAIGVSELPLLKRDDEPNDLEELDVPALPQDKSQQL